MERGHIAANFYRGCAVHLHLKRAFPTIRRASSNHRHFARLVLGGDADSDE